MATIGKSIQILYAGRLEYFLESGFDITVVCAPSELDDAIRARGLKLHTLPLTRAITPLTDCKTLVELCRFFQFEKFDLIEVSTPKAALLGSLAAWLTHSGPVVHCLQGLVYEGATGLQGALLRASTWVPCRLADLTLAVSNSVREQVLADALCEPEQIQIPGPGTLNGIDIQRFSPEKRVLGLSVRHQYNIAPDAVVFGFVGRMTRDKGLEELIDAFASLHAEFALSMLLIVGDYEHRDRPSEGTMRRIATHPAVRHAGWQADVVPFMAAMDVFVLPTYREGFPTVVLEAAAMEIPVVSTNATGARDAVIDGNTGLRVPARDAMALKEAMSKLVAAEGLRRAMGQVGRAWVSENFRQKDVWQIQVDIYRKLVSQVLL